MCGEPNLEAQDFGPSSERLRGSAAYLLSDLWRGGPWLQVSSSVKWE